MSKTFIESAIDSICEDITRYDNSAANHQRAEAILLLAAAARILPIQPDDLSLGDEMVRILHGE